ncbi:unnamed protein product [Amoebophrya sp. A120]|nr:unnamed protein product [Amoebophrya sp. A120]|eukprot:GSA120T00012227001.1
MFGNSKKLEELENQLKETQEKLTAANSTIQANTGEITKLKAEEKKTKDALTKKEQDAKKLQQDKEKVDKEKQSLQKEIKDKWEKDLKTAKDKAAEDKKKLKEKHNDLQKERDELQKETDERIKSLSLEKQLLEQSKAELEEKKQVLETTLERKNNIIQLQEEDSQTAKFFLDVSIDGCEFAKPFPYFLTVQLGDEFTNPRKTETSASTQYPEFENSSFLLPFHDEDTENQLLLKCFVVVNPERGDESTVKQLGEAVVSLHELGALKSERQDPRLQELRQKTIVQNASFLRRIDGAGKEADVVLVGKSMLRIEKKLLKPSESLKLQLQSADGATEIERVRDKALAEELNQGLWLVTPFQHRLRILCHCAKDILYQQGGGSSSSSAPAPGAAEKVGVPAGGENIRSAAGGTTTSIDNSLITGTEEKSSSSTANHPSNTKGTKLVVTARILKFDGTVLYEVPSTEHELSSAQFGTASRADILDYLLVNEELVLPLPNTNSLYDDPGGTSSSNVLRDQRCELSITVTNRKHVQEIFSVQFFLNVLPAFEPVTVHCAPSGSSTSNLSSVVMMGNGREGTASQSEFSNNKPPKPQLCFTVTREIPLPDIAETYHGLEFRCHGIPTARPLPEMANHAVLLVSPDFPTTAETNMPSPRVTVVRYQYDTQRDLTSILEGYFKENLATYPRPPKYFMTPVSVSRSRAPQFDQYVVRLAAAERNLQHLSVFLFEQNLLRSEPTALLPDFLLGFASVDSSTLTPPEGARNPLHRAYHLDLRLLEDPTRPASLAVDVRVWGRNIRPEALHASAMLGSDIGNYNNPSTRYQSPQKSLKSVSIAPQSPQSMIARSPDVMMPAAGAQQLHGQLQPRANATLVHQQQNHNQHVQPLDNHHYEKEFTLNQDLSIQLMREFNLRAQALKSAGEEIVELRKTVQILQNENAKLNTQLEEELQFNEEVKLNQPLNTELLDSLSTAELAQKLQTTVAKYRDEKQKVQDLKLRMESGMREIVKNRGLERKLEELEKAHLEQATLLQKYQKDNKKIGLYKETVKSQEKVIAKLEKVLETSLEDLHKAQQNQIDLEKARHENAQLKLEYQNVQKKNASSASSHQELAEMKKQLHDKQLEYDKLREICEQLEREQQSGRFRRNNEDEKQMLQYKINQLEARIHASEQVIRDNGKKTSKELATLKLEIAKKDAKIKELNSNSSASAGGAVGGRGMR